MKAVVRLSHPAPMDVVLRKRIAVNIYKKQSFTSKLVKSFIGSYNTIYDSGIMYEIVSNIPKASEELEDRESLAKMAANAEDSNEEDDLEGETYIGKSLQLNNLGTCFNSTFFRKIHEGCDFSGVHFDVRSPSSERCCERTLANEWTTYDA